MSAVVDETVRSAVIRARTAQDPHPGQRPIERRRWLCDVVRALTETEKSRDAALALLWAAHLSGEIRLSRCDLPQRHDWELVKESATEINGGTFHFVQLVGGDR